MESTSELIIPLDHIKVGLSLWVGSKKGNDLFDAKAEAFELNEAQYQLKEGCFYDYELSYPEYMLGEIGENIIQSHKRKKNIGVIAPNIFVGTLTIPIIEIQNDIKKGEINLEVQSVKTGYRDDYRNMLEFITEQCTDILLQINSPVTQQLETDYSKDNKSLYQQFAFIKSIIGTEDFNEAIHRIISVPVTKWKETTEEREIRNVRRFSNANIREFQRGGRKIKLQEDHYLRPFHIDSLPEKIISFKKIDTVDTPENRFIKYALEIFLKTCVDINSAAKKWGYKDVNYESEFLIRELENHLHHTVFKSISRPITLKLNSPVLQRKEGYREVLKVWLMFDLAAKLIWHGGDEVYSGGKKDVATLYEYWLFFKLLDILKSIFNIQAEDVNNLIVKTPDGLHLTLKQGKFTALNGVYNAGNRKLKIKFNYNRTFSGRSSYPHSGSWTSTLRPDYTLSIWPFGINENDAEKEELIVHIHFDAKYKVANFIENFEVKDDDELNTEDIENRKGIYKNADLLKMHAYKDAIRRTAGAYVLYPGDKLVKNIGFHEVIPGLGAFALRPSKTNEGTGELQSFISEVVQHFLNRTSQREKLALRTYNIYKNPPDTKNIVHEAIPETIHSNRDLIPDETYILVGYYKSEEHLTWIKQNKLYNFRMGIDKGALPLDVETVSSKYLLLYTEKDEESGELWKINGKGPRVFSKKNMEEKNYPSPNHESYLIFEIVPVDEFELKDKIWQYKLLSNYKTLPDKGIPFTTTLSELMSHLKK